MKKMNAMLPGRADEENTDLNFFVRYTGEFFTGLIRKHLYEHPFRPFFGRMGFAG